MTLSNSGERMIGKKILAHRMHAAYRIVTRESGCTKSFTEFNGNCESYCSLEQLVASLCTAHEGNKATGTYYSKTNASPDDTCRDLQMYCVVKGALGLE